MLPSEVAKNLQPKESKHAGYSQFPNCTGDTTKPNTDTDDVTPFWQLLSVSAVTKNFQTKKKCFVFTEINGCYVNLTIGRCMKCSFLILYDVTVMQTPRRDSI